jgi:hypothetical protein
VHSAIAKLNAYQRAQRDQNGDENLPTALAIAAPKSEKAK